MNYYPPVGYSFSVSLMGVGAAPVVGGVITSVDGNFKEVTGLTSDITVTPYQEGGVRDFAHPLPSHPKHTNITLKRGLAVNSAMAAWVQSTVEEFVIVPMDLLISLLGPTGFPICAWVVENAYPIKWDVSGLNAMSNEIVIETIELACRKHRRLPI